MGPENIELLNVYKSKCILKNKLLPAFSKEIKLSFHAHHGEPSKRQQHSNDESVIQDNAIYQLQTIKVNNERFTMFYDSGCGDVVSRFQAIKRLGTSAVQEHPGPIFLGGVGDINTFNFIWQAGKFSIQQSLSMVCTL